MSAVFQPFGLKPVYSESGIDRAARFDASFWTGSVNTKFYNTATTFYQYSPLTISAAGVVDVVQAVGGAATNTQIYGVFIGAEYNTPTGERRNSKYFVDGLASTTGDAQVWFWVLTDLGVVFEIQANGPVANGTVGGEFNFIASGAGAVGGGIVLGTGGGAGFSTAGIAAAEVAGAAQGQVRCVGLGRGQAGVNTGPNLWNDAFTVLQVRLANTSNAAVKPNLS